MSQESDPGIIPGIIGLVAMGLILAGAIVNNGWVIAIGLGSYISLVPLAGAIVGEEPK